MNSGMIAENIFSAIDVIVDKKLREAKYDSTIIAKIIKVQDSALGRYEVQYQDAKFTALSVGGGAYNEGDLVYILIPTNDLSRDKYILGLGNSNRRITALGDIVTTAQLEAIVKRIEELEKQEIPTVVVDDSLSTSSSNPVQNKVVTNEVNSITNRLTKLENTTPSIDLTDYYTKSEVDGKIPSLNGYATEDWVEEQISDLGSGDMLKSIYDTDGDGIIDKAKDANALGGVKAESYATQSWVQSQGYKTTDNDTTYSKATENTLGLVRVGFPESGQYYPVELNDGGQMYVHVPWTDNVGEGADGNTTYTIGWDDTNRRLKLTPSLGSAQYQNIKYATNAGDAERATQASTALKLDVSAGSTAQPVYFSDGIPVATTYKLEKSVPADAQFTDTTYVQATSNTLGLVKIGYTQNNKNYPVQLSDGKMFVNVPWSNTNTTYTLTTKDNNIILQDGQEDTVSTIVAPYADKAGQLEKFPVAGEADGTIDSLGGVYGYHGGVDLSSGYNRAYVHNGIIYYTDKDTDTGATKVTVTGTGNAITAATYNATTRTITLTKGGTYNNYSLPKATSDTLGGVTIGDNISISEGSISLTKTNVTNALGYDPANSSTVQGNINQLAQQISQIGGIAETANTNANSALAVAEQAKNTATDAKTQSSSNLTSIGKLADRISAVENAGYLTIASASSTYLTKTTFNDFKTQYDALATTVGTHNTKIATLESNDSTFSNELKKLNNTVTSHSTAISQKADQSMLNSYLTIDTANDTLLTKNEAVNTYATIAGLQEYYQPKLSAGTGVQITNNTIAIKQPSGADLGGVRTTSKETSSTGYSPCPIINGYIYYQDTNTHHTAQLYATTATGNAHAETTNGNTYLRLQEDGVNRNSIGIHGTGRTAVSSNADGIITINTPEYSNATTSVAGLMSANDKIKLDNLSNPDLSNYISFDNLKGGNTTFFSGSANSIITSATSQIYPVAGDQNGVLAVYVPWTNTTYSNATSSSSGLMSSSDKKKLDGLTMSCSNGVLSITYTN